MIRLSTTVPGASCASCAQKFLLRLLICALALLSALAVHAAQGAQRAAQLTGVVVRVIDGDSLLFQPSSEGPTGSRRPAPIEVRLADLDAPESCQAHGRQAKAALAELSLNKELQLRRVARDAYGRQVARLSVGGIDVGKRLVEEGHAWSARWRNGRGPLMKQERVAKALRRGLHAQADAVLPSEFRLLHGPCAAQGRQD